MGVDLHADWIRISKAGQGDEPEFSGATLSALADGEIGIEDPNLLPVVGMRGDEDLVPLGLLVGVVGGARVKHDVEGDLPVAVVDVPVVRGTAADGEDDLAGVAGEVVTAAGYETLDRGRGTILEPKENGVGEHGGGKREVHRQIA